jgi:cyclohexadieny/prephenate dehydrogenase
MVLPNRQGSMSGTARIAIVGGGLIGASIALAARRHLGVTHVAMADPSPEIRGRLAALHIADSVSERPGPDFAAADLVVIATPVSAFAAVANALSEVLRAGAVVTDAGSVKGCVLRDLAPLIAAGFRVVPSHPLAGGHQTGPDHADADLFLDKLCIVTPPEASDEAAIGAVGAFWRGLGMEIDIMNAETHDRVLAATSHLPHLIASAAVECVAQAQSDIGFPMLRYAASGFRDATRIAASNPALWRDIYLENKHAVIEMATVLEQVMVDLKSTLQADDAISLEAFLTRTQHMRRSLAN